MPWLVEIYQSCISLGHVPHPWKRAPVALILKAGRPLKDDYGEMAFLLVHTDTAPHEAIGTIDLSLQ